MQFQFDVNKDGSAAFMHFTQALIVDLPTRWCPIGNNYLCIRFDVWLLSLSVVDSGYLQIVFIHSLRVGTHRPYHSLRRSSLSPIIFGTKFPKLFFLLFLFWRKTFRIEMNDMKNESKKTNAPTPHDHESWWIFQYERVRAHRFQTNLCIIKCRILSHCRRSVERNSHLTVFRETIDVDDDRLAPMHDNSITSFDNKRKA